MPDTKTGREKQGKNKRAQLRMRLAEREIETLNGDAEEEPALYADTADDLVADELPTDE